MLPHSFAQGLTELRSALSVPPFFEDYLKETATLRRVLCNMFVHAVGEGRFHTHKSSWLNKLTTIDSPDAAALQNKLRRSVSNLSPSLTFKVIHQLQTALISIPLSRDLPSVRRFSHQLESFETAYEEFLSDGTLGIERVTSAAGDLGDSLRSIDEWTSGILNALTPDEGVPEHYRALSILFEGHQSLESIRSKLEAIIELYGDFSSLAGVDTREFPLQVRNLQYGSFWIDVIGNEAVVGLMASAVASAAVLLYRRFRESGKLPRGAQQLESLLRLREQMKSQGLDTSASDEELEHVFAKISRNLNVLVGGEPVVEVNGERISLPEHYRAAYLTEGKQRLLESGGAGGDT